MKVCFIIIRKGIWMRCGFGKKAADAGNAKAINFLGLMHQHGEGVNVDYPKAMAFFLQAAKAGNIDAMSNIGWMYDKALGLA